MPRTHEDTLKQVTELVGELSPLGIREPAADARIIEDLGYDSVALVELAMLLESELGVPHIDEEDAVECNTITELVAFLDKVMSTTD